MSERLTCLDSEGIVSTAQYGKLRSERYGTQQCLEKLYEYENLEDDGRLIGLPCKVGDTVYEIIEETGPKHYFYISGYTVQDISTHQIRYADDWFDLKEFENNIFFSRKEAEAKLKEMEKNNAE